MTIFESNLELSVEPTGNLMSGYDFDFSNLTPQDVRIRHTRLMKRDDRGRDNWVSYIPEQEQPVPIGDVMVLSTMEFETFAFRWGELHESFAIVYPDGSINTVIWWRKRDDEIGANWRRASTKNHDSIILPSWLIREIRLRSRKEYRRLDDNV